MRVIAVSIPKAFWESPADRNVEQPLKALFAEASKARWKQPSDIETQYCNTSILKGHRVVFNIKSNDYRLVVAVCYKLPWFFIKFVGTHKAYDLIDAETVEPA